MISNGAPETMFKLVIHSFLSESLKKYFGEADSNLIVHMKYDEYLQGGFMPIEHYERGPWAPVKYGFDDRTYNILATARRVGDDGITYKELAKNIGIRAETIFLRVNKLANYGLVRVAKNPPYANRIIVCWDELHIVDATQYTQTDFEEKVLKVGSINALPVIQKITLNP